MSRARVATQIDSISAAPGELRFTAELAGRSQQIWMRSSVPVVPGADVAVALTLIAAMTEPGPLRVEAPVDRRFVRRLGEIQAVLGAWHRDGQWTALAPVANRVEVLCPVSEFPPPPGERRVAAFFSGGVDSFATLLRNPEITDLIYVEGLDVPVGTGYADHHARVRETVIEPVAERLGKAVVYIGTNARDLYAVPGLQGPVYGGSIRAAAARFLAPRFARVFVAAAQHYDHLLPNSAHPLLEPLWGSGDVELVHDGADLTRLEKLEAITDDETAQSTLRVCWEDPAGARNCGRCEKCLRTMVGLEVLGRRERFRTFPPDLDLDAVAEARDVTDPNVRFWSENLAGAFDRGASPELIAALETCVAAMGPPRSPTASLSEPVPAEDHRRLRIAHERVEARLDELEELAAWQGARLGDIEGSASWRWTAPLRRVTGLLRGRRSPG